MKEDMDAPILESSCSEAFPNLRVGERVEIMQTTSIKQDELLQVSSAQSKLKLLNGICSFSAVGLPVGNAAGGALLQDMTYYVQARAARNRDFDVLCSNQISELEQNKNEDCLDHKPSQLSHPETAKFTYSRLQPDDVVEDTESLHKGAREGFRSSKCLSDHMPCSNGTGLKDSVKIVDSCSVMQRFIAQSLEGEATAPETARIMNLSQFGHQTCISEEPLQSVLLEPCRPDSTPYSFRPSNVFEQTGYLHLSAVEGCESSKCFNDNGKLCIDYNDLNDGRTAIRETFSAAETSKWENDNCISQNISLQLTNLEGKSVSNKLMENAAHICEGFEILKCSGSNAESGSGGYESKDGARSGHESNAKGLYHESLSDAQDVVETVGHSKVGQFGNEVVIVREPLQSGLPEIATATKNCENMKPLQSTPQEDGRVDSTDHTSEPDNLLKEIGCIHNSACKDSGSVKCIKGDTKLCSCDTELKDVEEVLLENSAMQPCVETSEPEVSFSLEIDGLLRSSHISNEGLGDQKRCHLIFAENDVVVSSSTFGTNIATVTRGSPSRIEIVDNEGPECMKCISDHAISCGDMILHKGNGESVCKRDASEMCFSLGAVHNGSIFEKVTVEHTETSSAKSKAVDLVFSRRSSPETGNKFRKQENALVLPASSVIRPQGEDEACHCVTHVGSLVVQETALVPAAFSTSSCEQEEDSVSLLPLLSTLHPPDEPIANCEAKIVESSKSKDLQNKVRSADYKSSVESQSFGRSCDNTLASSAKPCSMQGQIGMGSETKQEELSCRIGKIELGDSATPRNDIVQNGDTNAKNGSYLSIQSHTDIVRQPDKFDYLVESSLSCPSRYSRGGKNRLEKASKSLELRELSNHQKLGCIKEIKRGNLQELKEWKLQETLANGNRLKRKATDEPQEMAFRTGLREKHHSDGSLSKGLIAKRSDNDTLMSFRDHVVLQKQADALKRKAMESRKGLDQREKSNQKLADSNKQSFKEMSQKRELDWGEEKQKKVALSSSPEMKSLSSLQAPVIKNQSLKLLTRDIAKKALLEAGFRIDLRPRKSRHYHDSVYVSPDGHTHWSLPKAWEALKKLQAEKFLDNSAEGFSHPHDSPHVTESDEKAGPSSVIKYEKGESLAKVDKNALKVVFSRFGNDERLNSALTKRGTCSVTNELAQNVTRQADLTNADLTDFLVGDLGVLRRFTKKFYRQQRKELNKSDTPVTPRLREADTPDEKRGLKRKLDSIDTLEMSDQKDLEDRGSAKKSQGVSLFKSRDNRKQGTSKSLKQMALGPKTLVLKHKAKEGEREGKTAVLKPMPKKRERPKSRSGLRLEVRHASSGGSEEPACHSTRTVFAWMLDRGAVLERERIFLVDQIDHQVVKEGVITREGILCSCCKIIFTVQGFEAHAGGPFGDWHQTLVFTSGKRLLDCQRKAWDAEIHLRKARNYVGISEDDTNDDSCLLCGDGGDLICCDGCPSTFHASCLNILSIPDGDWYCPKCSCGTCGGRQCGEEKEDSAVIVCSQCELRYHIACLHSCPITTEKDVFCRSSCHQIFSSLRGLVGISQSLPGGFSWSLLRRMEEDKVTNLTQSTMQIDCHSKLAVALLVIKECFNPIVDPRTNIDMITHAMYNRWSDFNRLNYAGFYTAVLEKEGEVISVASIRVHGVRLAEMPLIGTREKYRRKGMCRLLVGIIEKLLSSLNVAYFILPAIAELFDTWTQAFGFRPLDGALKSSLKDISMMVFPGTELLQKPLSVTSMADTMPLQAPHGDS